MLLSSSKDKDGVEVNPHWHELWKQEKCSSLAPPRFTFYKTQWAWKGFKLTQLMSIFTSEKVWKVLIKNQLTKSDQKNDKEIKVSPLMPIRVKVKMGFLTNSLATKEESS